MDNGIAPNAKRLLYAGFMAILAAGVGFSIRAGILGQWAEQYGFTMTELGLITGGGLTGFGVIIILSSLIADRVGYGKLMVSAFVLHLLSAVLTLAAGAAFKAGGKPAAFQCLYWGMFLFAIGNGVCEAVVNPLVATLFPKEKTHYLNILHAGWPGGLIIGGLASYFMAAGAGDKAVAWQVQMSLFLIPVVIYGLMLLGQRFPKSEASEHGVSFGQMLAEFASPVLLVLLLIHALVGYVELGTDSWIGKITGAIMSDPKKGLLLFVYTSGLMFALRFFAGPIVHRTSPLGLLCASGVLGCIGLTLLGNATSIIYCVIAATVYACGKTFLWPTMLAVVSERFPKGGAVTIGAMGGVGMLSAGLLGGPGIGFKQDYHAAKQLQTENPAVYERYKASAPNTFLTFKTTGLDGSKVGVLEDEGKELTRANELLAKEGKKDENSANLLAWWTAAKPSAAQDKPLVQGASLHGGRMALKITAAVPATMAVLYLLLILYFKSRGGYKQVHIHGAGKKAEEVAEVS
ncbi:MAG: Major Facilitator Superfamily protein [Verrucomicrobiales bacterium]|nr:Major Facilitator Superfamily protein [Verrucomicrobiales bacterium]